MRALVVLLLLGGCTLGPPPREPRHLAPDRFAENGDAAAGWPEAGWWKGFGSAELDRLVTAALAANTDLAAASARLRQADAQVRIAGASLLPTLQADAGAGATRGPCRV